MEGMHDAASKHHKDASAPHMKMDENDVNKAMHTIEIWVNPFKSSSIVSFIQSSPACGRKSLLALSLWPCHQLYRPRLVGGRGGGGPSYVAPHSRNPPTGRRRDSPSPHHCFRTAHPCVRSV